MLKRAQTMQPGRDGAGTECSKLLSRLIKEGGPSDHDWVVAFEDAPGCQLSTDFTYTACRHIMDACQRGSLQRLFSFEEF